MPRARAHPSGTALLQEGAWMDLRDVSEVERFLWRFGEHGVKRLSAGGAAQRLAEGVGQLLRRGFLNQRGGKSELFLIRIFRIPTPQKPSGAFNAAWFLAPSRGPPPPPSSLPMTYTPSFGAGCYGNRWHAPSRSSPDRAGNYDIAGSGSGSPSYSRCGSRSTRPGERLRGGGGHTHTHVDGVRLF